MRVQAPVCMLAIYLCVSVYDVCVGNGVYCACVAHHCGQGVFDPCRTCLSTASAHCNAIAPPLVTPSITLVRHHDMGYCLWRNSRATRCGCSTHPARLRHTTLILGPLLSLWPELPLPPPSAGLVPGLHASPVSHPTAPYLSTIPPHSVSRYLWIPSPPAMAAPNQCPPASDRTFFPIPYALVIVIPPP